MSFQSEVRSNSEGIGEDPRIAQIGQADYRRLRDLRSAARDEERRQEAQDPADRQMRIAPQWAEVATLSARLLADVGRDIEVAIWWIEAETRLKGHAGMAQALSALTQMVEAHGRDLHPQPEDADDRPFDMIAALNGVGREGTLIQPLRLLPLVTGAGYGEACLWSTQAGAEPETAAAISEAGLEAARNRLTQITAARDAAAACDAALTDLLGADAPPFSQIQDVLEETSGVLRRLSGVSEAFEEAEDAEQDADTASDATGRAKEPGVIRNREDAFDQLLLIARYFRQFEPHSPMADTLETLVRRGRMDFLTLIEELIPDPNARQSVMTTAGIGKKPTEPKGG